jgi:hypothetical protein
MATLQSLSGATLKVDMVLLHGPTGLKSTIKEHLDPDHNTGHTLLLMDMASHTHTALEQHQKYHYSALMLSCDLVLSLHCATLPLRATTSVDI